MSRSRKKVPMHGLCGVTREHHRFCKRKMVRKTRRWLNKTDEVSDGNQFKKADFTWRPDDGLVYDPQWLKSYQK